MISPDITAIASFASIASLIISVYVAVSLNKMRKLFKFKARMPQLLERLNELASQLSNQMDIISTWSSDIDKTLVEIDVLLGTLRNIGDNYIKSLSKEIQKNIKTLSLAEKNKKDLDEIYISLYKLHKQSVERLEDTKWQ